MDRESKKKKIRKRKRKVIGYSFLGLIIVAAVIIGVGFYRLQPKNHFKNIPVIESGSTTTEALSTNTPALNILLMGSDAEPGQTIGHSDTMMLAHVDLKNNTISAISIPRDTRVYLNGVGYTKLTSVQYMLEAKNGVQQGVQGAVQAISQLTGVPINYYVETSFNGLKGMVDALGGITMDVPQNTPLSNGTVITKGSHFLDGTTVLALTRERHSLADGDYGRQQAQLAAIEGIAKSALSPSNITKLPSLVNSMQQFIVATNMSTSDMVSLGLAEKDFNPKKDLHYEQIQETPENLYDDALQAYNDELVINPQQMKAIIAKYFQS